MSERSITTIPSTPRLIRVCITVLVALFAQAVMSTTAFAADEYRVVSVADPYLELRTGPGRGYPVFHVVDRGETVEIMKRRTD